MGYVDPLMTCAVALFAVLATRNPRGFWSAMAFLSGLALKPRAWSSCKSAGRLS